MEYYDPGSLSVQLYDLLETTVRDMEREVAHYAACAAGIATPILEVGVGTGRLAWPLAALGHAVVGIDCSTAMLERAEAKRTGHPDEVGRRVTFLAADMTTFDLGRRFDLITVPFRAFNCLTTHEAQEAFLRTAGRHLSDSGRMIIDLYIPPPQTLTPGLQPQAPGTLTINFRNSPHRIERTFLGATSDHARQHLTFRVLYRMFEADTLRSEQDLRLTYRWTTPEQMEELLDACGLWVAKREPSPFSPHEDGCEDELWTIGRR